MHYQHSKTVLSKEASLSTIKVTSGECCVGWALVIQLNPWVLVILTIPQLFNGVVHMGEECSYFLIQIVSS